MFARVSMPSLFRGLVILAGIAIVLAVAIAAYIRPGTPHRAQEGEALEGVASDMALVAAQGASRSGEAKARVGQYHARLLRALVQAPASEGVEITSVIVTISGDGDRWGVPALELWRDVEEDGSVDEERDSLLAEMPGDEILQSGGQPYLMTRPFVDDDDLLTTLEAGERCELVIAVSQVGAVEGPGEADAEDAAATSMARRWAAFGLVLCIVGCVAPRGRQGAKLLLCLTLAVGLAMIAACDMSAPPRGPGADPTVQLTLTGVRMHGATTHQDLTQLGLEIGGPVVTITR